MKTFLRIAGLVCGLWAGAVATVALAADALPPGVTLINLENVKWVKTISGRDQAYIMGHPSKPGPYLYLVKWGPNDKAGAHFHPEDRFGVVLQGVHYIGYGDKFDEKKLHEHKAGTFFNEPAKTSHFGMTKSEGAILYFYGVGPTGSTALEKLLAGDRK